MNPKNYLTLLLIVPLVSCGGGGGGGSSDPESPSIFNPVINTFTASATSIVAGSSVDLSWTTTNAIECSGSVDWEGNKATGSGSETLTLSDVRSYTFTLTCRGEDPQNTVAKSVTVEVSDSSGSGSDIYAEDKSSYCKVPENNTSNYWIEEFSSEVLNEEFFSYEVGNGFFSNGQWIGGWGNEESQYYTSCDEGYSKFCNESTKATENTFIENGYLKIQPIYWNPDYGQTPFDDPYCETNDCSSWGGTFDYTSGKLITRDKFTVTPGNEVTVCFKVPEGSGHWPAFWMMPQSSDENTKSWPRDGEIDIMEHMSSNQDNQIQSTVHDSNNNSVHSYKWGIETIPQNVNFVDKFHSITFKWIEDKLEFYLDTHNEPFHSIDRSTNQDFLNGAYWPFNESFYLIMNLAVGGTNGGDININAYCQDIECSNLSEPDKGRLLIDYIEVKSIN